MHGWPGESVCSVGLINVKLFRCVHAEVFYQNNTEAKLTNVLVLNLKFPMCCCINRKTKRAFKSFLYFLIKRYIAQFLLRTTNFPRHSRGVYFSLKAVISYS
jgi:hypothetical protein